jgi:diadenosine tetraphosphate (Ap4A) HIT family hydrolase
MTCELCDHAGGEILWQDRQCRIVLVADPDYPGFCRVIWNQHIKEMNDLTAAERHHLMSRVFAVEQAVQQSLAPDKINLASLGNVVPHLHWHIVPRYHDDRHFPNPIWGTTLREGRPRPTADLAKTLREALENAL